MDHPLDRLMLQAATEVLRPLLDVQALDYLIEHPNTMFAVITMRNRGKLSLSLSITKKLVEIGVFSVDENGYYLSEVVEDVIDSLFVEWEKRQ